MVPPCSESATKLGGVDDVGEIMVRSYSIFGFANPLGPFIRTRSDWEVRLNIS